MSTPSVLRAGHSLRYRAIPETSQSFLILCSVVPSISSSVQRSVFSTTSPQFKRTRDYNRNRGVSALRRTGPRHPLSVSNEPLPRPVLDPKKRSKVQVDENHGLWQFFKGKKALSTPEDIAEHGRPWVVEELRNKSWEDLHSLWWICAKERNWLATQIYERQRLKAGYGEAEEVERAKAVRTTQRTIKHVLTERQYAWENARELASQNPDIIRRLDHMAKRRDSKASLVEEDSLDHDDQHGPDAAEAIQDTVEDQSQAVKMVGEVPHHEQSQGGRATL
ncbi:MAG: hypothetical protein M1812_003014 [Candelaria pacifica]|nr:MAG: hypothetical protein M1812_003014 [Candelaria pacifica]